MVSQKCDTFQTTSRWYPYVLQNKVFQMLSAILRNPEVTVNVSIKIIKAFVDDETNLSKHSFCFRDLRIENRLTKW